MANGRFVERGTGTSDPVERPPAVRWPWLLSDAGVLTAALIVAGVGVVALVVMLRIADHAPTAERAKLEIEALKYGLGFFAAAGAVAALLLAVRRQRLSERAHELALEAQRLSERNHQLTTRAQAHTETDAAERRVTDLYGKAVEQLGSADAAVRLGGLYALERVAQNNPGQRQTIVNVLCAYLRMPYTPPPGPAQPAPAAPLTALPLGSPPPAATSGRDSRQELQVRLTAQRILTTHLRLPSDVDGEPHAEPLTPGPQQPFWPDIDLDLTGATLIDWDLHRGQVRAATFTGATFTGRDAGFGGATFTGAARFSEATFTGGARFGEATFTGDAGFHGVTFTGDARFSEATFNEYARFSEATFVGDARFGGATFVGDAGFREATFTGDARFSEATFTEYAWFSEATFNDYVWFGEATFNRDARFDGATFAQNPLLAGARVASRKGRNDVWPSGWRLVPGPETDRLVYETGQAGLLSQN